MKYQDRIVRDPHISGGEPVIRGTRVTLRTLLASLAEGCGEEEILRNFPALTSEDIRAVIDAAGPFHLLRRHVVRRSHDLMGAGQRQDSRCASHELSQAEVGNLDPAAAIDQDILRFDIAMDEFPFMGVLKGIANLRNDLQGDVRRDGSSLHELPKVEPVHILHDKVI